MICPNCNSQNTDNVVTCIYCGTELDKNIQNNENSQHKELANSEKDFEDILRRGYTVKIKDYIIDGWNLFKKDALLYIAYTLFIFAIPVILIALIGRSLALALFLATIVLVAAPALNMGYHAFALRRVKGQEAEFINFFDGFNKLGQLILNLFVKGILVFIGFLLFILPGIYLAIAYTFSELLIIDRGQNFWDAMKNSKKVVNKNWFSVFGFTVVMTLLFMPFSLLSNIITSMGIISENTTPVFIASYAIPVMASILYAPIASCIVVTAYRDIFGIKEER